MMVNIDRAVLLRRRGDGHPDPLPTATSPAGPDRPKSLPGTVRTQLPSAAFTSVTELHLTSDHPALGHGQPGGPAQLDPGRI